MSGIDASTTCACCGAPVGRGGETLFDDRYGHPGSFQVAKCGACGAFETFPRLDEKDLPALYTKYYPRRLIGPDSITVPLGAPDGWVARLSRWWQGTDNQGQYYAKPGMTVLDYGCGIGQSLLDLRAMGADAYGVEADANVAPIAAYHGLQIHIGSIYDDPFPGVNFDLIILNQVLEHIPNPAELLRRLAARLKRGGRLIVAVPNTGSIYRFLFRKRWINWHIPYHLHHFNRACLRTLGRRTGWCLIGVRTITPNLWTVLQLRVLAAPAQQGVPSPVWSPEATAAARIASGLVGRIARLPLRLATRIGMLFIAVVNRGIDALGLGDSLLCVFVRQEASDAASRER
ncbi:MAG: methyltransferase domain-containing protein [Burkholderiales bacterium]|nr:methyltransferase domain-containing protein [Burkholderiales bacterium]